MAMSLPNIGRSSYVQHFGLIVQVVNSRLIFEKVRLGDSPPALAI